MNCNIKCPKCGAEQRRPNLEETDGSFVCSKCEKHFKFKEGCIVEEPDEQKERAHSWTVSTKE